MLQQLIPTNATQTKNNQQYLRPAFRLLMAAVSLVLATLLSGSRVYGQKTNQDLRLQLAQAPNDSQRLEAYHNYFKENEFSTNDSVSQLLKVGLESFIRTSYKPGIAKLLIDLADIYSTQGMQDIARKNCREAISIFKELADKTGIAVANNALGISEGRRGNFTEAIQHFETALKIYNETNDTPGIVNTYLKIGTANEFSNNLDEALAYYNKALKIGGKNLVKKTAAFIYNNIGVVYARKNQLDTAELYVQKSLDECTASNMETARITALTNMGNIAGNKGNTPLAMQFFSEGIEIAKKGKLRDHHARLLINMASAVMDSDHNKTLALLYEALLITREIGQKNLQSEVLLALADAYKELNEYKMAYAMMEQNKSLEDSISRVNKAKAIANLEDMYATERLNNQIRKLEAARKHQENRKNIIIIVALLLSVGFITVIVLLINTTKLNKKLKSNEQLLQQTNQVKDKLFSVIGHDLRGPIGNIPTVLQLCRDEHMPQNERDSILQMLEVSAIACSETLDNLLNWGKRQMKGITNKQQVCDAHRTLENVLQLMTITATNKNITISNELATNTEVLVEPNHLQFIFRNLISNAIKYSHQNGQINITATAAPQLQTIRFSVTDHGVGIPPAKMETIFKSFGESTKGTANENGNGLGLLLCREYVEENGGTIGVESIPGQSTTFYFTLKTNSIATQA